MRGETIILAAGDFPGEGSEAMRLLSAAKRVVCCDGALDAYRRRFGKWPTATVGDMDSASLLGGTVIQIAEQNTNDLEKAARYCQAQNWRAPVVLGATGKREDHTLGNVFISLRLNLEIVSDFGRFVPLEGRRSFLVEKDTGISIFAPDPATRMTSKGLRWPLDGVVFDRLCAATLNRSSARRVTLESTRRVMVYFAF